jgi:hypothetical protein
MRRAYAEMSTHNIKRRRLFRVDAVYKQQTHEKSNYDYSIIDGPVAKAFKILSVFLQNFERPQNSAPSLADE